MAVAPESSPLHNSENNPLHEALQTRFDSLLRSYAEQLEFFTKPDKLTLDTKDAQFGQFCDGELNVSHSIINSTRSGSAFHTGKISFLHPDDASRSFFINHILSADGRGTTWKDSTQMLRGRKALQMLHRNWPISDTQDLDALMKIITSADGDAEPHYIFDVVESYIARNQAGKQAYGMHWDYTEPISDFIGREYVDAIELDITCNGNDDFRKIQARYTTGYALNGEILPLECIITTDEFNNVSITASYPDINTDEVHVKRIANYNELYKELEEALQTLVDEKSDY